MSLIDSLMPVIDDILSLRDQLGVALKKVGIVTRTWEGFEPGEGKARDSYDQILPTPEIVDFSHRQRIQTGGAVQQGDIILKHLSKKTYPQKSLIDCSTTEKKIEKFYDLGGELYQVISVKEDHFTWDVQVRKLSDQSRY